MAHTPEEIDLARRSFELMFREDAFSQWLGVENLEVLPGGCTLAIRVRKEMTNGFGIAHGGISFALADSALAFASNSRGRQAVSIETAISHLQPIGIGDRLIATAFEISLSRKLGRYRVEVRREPERELVALFRGTVYYTGKSII